MAAIGTLAQVTSGDYDAEWRSIRDSPLGSLYIRELYWLARGVSERLDALFASFRPPKDPSSSYLLVDPNLHREIQAILGDAGKTRLLLVDRPKRRDQSPREYAIQCRRAEWLRSLLDRLDIGPVLDAGVRNSLEHFDEYVDEMSLAAYDGEIPCPTSIAVDIATWDRGGLTALIIEPGWTVYALRLYVASERIFTNCQHEVDLGALREASSSIQERLMPAVNLEAREGRGAVVTILTDTSFTRPD